MTDSAACENPLVSIIIPVYADPDGLRTTLESVINQQYSPFEIIVSLTPASGETREVAEEYSSKYPQCVHIIEVQEQGRAKGRNAGINNAGGEIIAFVDADIRMNPEWLEDAVSDLKTKEAEYLACSVVIPTSTDNVGFVERYDSAISLPVNHYVENYHFAPTAALLLTRDLIDAIGDFDPELTSGEDREFGNRAHNNGYELHVSDHKVYHPPRETLLGQIQKAIRIGVGIEQLRRRYPDQYSYPSLISPLSYAPANPSRLKSRLSSNSYDPVFTEFILFYIFNHVLKLCQQFGRWKYYRSR